MFTFAVTPGELFDERARQFRGWGIPGETIARMRAAIVETWVEGEGGWCTEWSKEARRWADRGDPLTAALCFGAARFPFACTAERKLTQAAQVEAFMSAVPNFGCRFERIVVQAPFRGASTVVPVHVYEPSGGSEAVVLLSGGVDTYKIELHRLALALVRLGRFCVVTLDMPGTGESSVPLTPEATVIYRGIARQLARGRPVGLWGISFGGYFAARLALQGQVHCAVDLGGPVIAAPDEQSVLSLPNGMTGIVGNALGLDAMPTAEHVAQLVRAFSLRTAGLLDSTRVAAPLLVLNGTHDPYIPPLDSTVFAAMDNAEVLLVPGATHCAAEHFSRLVPTVIAWLVRHLSRAPLRRTCLAALARTVAPRFLRPMTPAP